MKFEYLMWIIIFLVFVVSTIVKKVRAASKTSGNGTAIRLPEWKEKLNKFMSQFQKMTWEEDRLVDLEPNLWKEISPDSFEQAREKMPLPKIKPALMKTEAESIEPAVSGKEILVEELGFGIQDLRKAVIWSEILAPPLALRDK